MHVWRGLVRRPLAMAGLVIAFAFVAIAVFAPVLAPYPPQEMIAGGLTAEGSPLRSAAGVRQTPPRCEGQRTQARTGRAR